MKIQIILSLIEPFVRLYTAIMLYHTYPDKFYSLLLGLVLIFIIAVSIDVAIIFFLRSKNVKRVFANAEEDRRIKFSKKLIKRNIGNVS